MQYYIKSKKSGSVKTLCTCEIDRSGKVKIASKIFMQIAHFSVLLNQIKTLPDNSDKKKIVFSDTLYAIRKDQQETGDLQELCKVWKSEYKKSRNESYPDFTAKELGMLKTVTIQVKEIQAFFACEEWFANTKTVGEFVKHLQDVRDFMAKQKQDTKKPAVPDTPTNTYLQSLKTKEDKVYVLKEWQKAGWEIHKDYNPAVGKFIYRFNTTPKKVADAISSLYDKK